jgi:hypothetical protein
MRGGRLGEDHARGGPHPQPHRAEGSNYLVFKHSGNIQ